MSRLYKRCLAFLCLNVFISGFSLAQTHTPKTIFVNSRCGGYYEYLPAGYDANQQYPLIIFLHGASERGSGSLSDLGRVLFQGIPKYIDYGSFPDSFTLGGSNYKFIVMSPQFNDWPNV